MSVIPLPMKQLVPQNDTRGSVLTMPVSAETEPADVGILVVHGIGGPKPSEALVELTDALQAHGCIAKRSDVIDARRLSGHQPQQANSKIEDRVYKSGPLPTVNAEAWIGTEPAGVGANQTKRICIAEVSWADVNKLPGGVAGVLRGYYDLLFKLRTLITTAVPLPPFEDPDVKENYRADFGEAGRVAGLPRDQEVAALQQWHFKIEAMRNACSSTFEHGVAYLASLTCKLISGPIACANLLLVLFFLLTWFLAPFFGLDLRQSSSNIPDIPASLLSWVRPLSIILLLAFGWLAWLRIERLEGRSGLHWQLHFLNWHVWRKGERRAESGRLGSDPKGLKWFSRFTLILALAAVYEWHVVEPETYYLSKFQGLLLPAFVPHYTIYIVGGLILPILLIFFCVLFLIQLLFRKPDDNAGLEVVLLVPIVYAALWMMIIPDAWRVLGLIYPEQLFSQLQPLIPSMMAGPPSSGGSEKSFAWDGLKAFTVISLVLVAILFWLSRLAGGGARRVIVAAPLSVAFCSLLIFAALHALFNSAMDLGLFPGGKDYFDDVDRWLTNFEVLTLGPTILAFAFSIGSESLRQGLALADDIITYLEFNGAEARRKECSIARAGKECVVEEMKKLQRRRPIRHCFKLTLEHLLDEKNVSKLLIVSHSQGTVIALDELLEARAWKEGQEDSFRNKSGKPVEVCWVTMGSPIHHLYQHYFPSCYPPFARKSEEDAKNTSEDTWNDGHGGEPESLEVRAYWQRLVKRVDQWINIYREDDIVGTHMGLGGERKTLRWPDKESRHKTVFREHAIDPGGHTRYWSDVEVVEQLAQVLEKWGCSRRPQHGPAPAAAAMGQ